MIESPVTTVRRTVGDSWVRQVVLLFRQGGRPGSAAVGVARAASSSTCSGARPVRCRRGRIRTPLNSSQSTNNQTPYQATGSTPRVRRRSLTPSRYRPDRDSQHADPIGRQRREGVGPATFQGGRTAVVRALPVMIETMPSSAAHRQSWSTIGTGRRGSRALRDTARRRNAGRRTASWRSPRRPAGTSHGPRLAGSDRAARGSGEHRLRGSSRSLVARRATGTIGDLRPHRYRGGRRWWREMRQQWWCIT